MYENGLSELFEVVKLPKTQIARVVNERSRISTPDRPESGELRRLTQARDRAAEMFEWGHIERSDYLRQRDELERGIESLERSTPNDEQLRQFARLMDDLGAAWAAADDEGKNRLAHSILEAVWIENKRVVAVTPRPELTPVFESVWQAVPDSFLHWRPRADLNRRSLP